MTRIIFSEYLILHKAIVTFCTKLMYSKFCYGTVVVAVQVLRCLCESLRCDISIHIIRFVIFTSNFGSVSMPVDVSQKVSEDVVRYSN